jgi:hypothetical protein
VPRGTSVIRTLVGSKHPWPKSTVAGSIPSRTQIVSTGELAHWLPMPQSISLPRQFRRPAGLPSGFRSPPSGLAQKPRSRRSPSISHDAKTVSPSQTSVGSTAKKSRGLGRPLRSSEQAGKRIARNSQTRRIVSALCTIWVNYATQSQAAKQCRFGQTIISFVAVSRTSG